MEPRCFVRYHGVGSTRYLTKHRGWESVFRDYPDILTDTENRNAVKWNIQKVKDYLQKLEDKL